MTEKEIIKTLSRENISIADNQFERKSVKEMVEIINFVKPIARDKNGNWTQKGIKEFAKKYKIQWGILVLQLRCLSQEYSVRKKKIKGLDKVTNLMYSNFFRIKRKNTKISLKNKKNIISFLEDLKRIKIKHLKTTNEAFIELVSKNIDTGYTKNTLLNYFIEKVGEIK